MKRGVVVCLVLAVAFLAAALFSHFYAARSMGLLPMINYPLRPYVLPFAIVSGVLAAGGVFLQVRKGK